MNKLAVKRIGLVFLLLMIISPIQGCVTGTTPPVSTGPSSANTVAVDSIQELDDRVVITLSGNTELSYTPYRLESPLRLVIDIPDAVFDKPEKDVAVGTETISKISKIDMTSDGKHVARLEIYLTEDTNYFVAKPSDYQIRVEVQKLSAGTASEPIGGSTAPVPSSTTLPPATKIINVVADDQADGTIVTILADGSVENFESFVLESPYRLVVDVKGLNNTFPAKEITVTGADIKAIRIGTYPDKTRVVMESVLPDKLNTYNVFPLDNKLMVSFRKAGETVLGSIPPPTPKETPAAAPPPSSPELPVTVLGPTTGYGQPPETPSSAPATLPGETAPAVESTVVAPGMEVAPADVASDERIYTGKPMTLIFSNAKVKDLINLIAEFSNVSIVIKPEVPSDLTLSLRLKRVPWDQALDLIVSLSGLGMVQRGNVIIVTTKAKLNEEIQSEYKFKKNLEDDEPLVTRLVNIVYRKNPNPTIGGAAPAGGTTAAGGEERPARLITDSIRDSSMLSTRGKIEWAPSGDVIIVTDTAARVEKIIEMIHLLDTPENEPEVRIEARIVEMNDTFEQDLGIKWVAGYNGDNGGTIKSAVGTLDASGLNNGSFFDAATTIFPQLPLTALNSFGGAGAMIGLLDGALRLDIELHALESLGEAQIIESPKVRVISDETAILSITTSIPQSNPIEEETEEGTKTTTSTVEYKDFETRLEITPTVNPDNTIKLDVNLTHNTQGEPVVLRNESGVENTYFTSFEKNLETKVLVDNRDTIVIGGLYRKESNSTDVGLPGLKDIPLLGWLFKTRNITDNRRELLIFITPTIVRSEDEARVGN